MWTTDSRRPVKSRFIYYAIAAAAFVVGGGFSAAVLGPALLTTADAPGSLRAAHGAEEDGPPALPKVESPLDPTPAESASAEAVPIPPVPAPSTRDGRQRPSAVDESGPGDLPKQDSLPEVERTSPGDNPRRL